MRAWIALGTALALASCSPSIDVTEGDVEQSDATVAFTDWDIVFDQAARVELFGLVTGEVEAGPEILIDDSDERLPDAWRRRLWVPSIAYLVRSDDRQLLLDTGLRKGGCAYGVRPIYWVPCRNKNGSDAISLLGELGVDPVDLEAIVLSHVHGDHASGLDDLLSAGAGPVWLGQPEREAMKSATAIFNGVVPSLHSQDFDGLSVDGLMQDMPIVGKAANVLGDGSLWLIPTPGHSTGHLSGLVVTEAGPVLLTFDASHLGIGFELGIPPGATIDKDLATASLDSLKQFAEAYPEMRVVYGHEPSQWPEIGQIVTLGN